MRKPGRPLFSLGLRACLGVSMLFGVPLSKAQVAVRIGKNHELVKQQFRSVIARANLSTVRIFSEDQPRDVALGTLVGSGSYVLTVASRLHGNLRCQLADGRQFPAKRIASTKPQDLALLRLAAQGLQPVIWSRGPLPPLGSLLATGGRGPDPVAIGVVSIPGSMIDSPWLWHDTTLRPNDCGGPAVDLAGRAVGINMVSEKRVTSRVLPAANIKKILMQWAADHQELADLGSDRIDQPRRQAANEPGRLKQLEVKIQAAAKRATACTVGLRIGRTMGSGVVISDDGYVLTAAHVSRQAGLPVEIYLADGRTVSGKTLGANHATDTGLIQIDPPGPWPQAKHLHGPAAQAGHWCVATGHPNGYRRGRPAVLRLGRILLAARDAIVTDCILNQGDSGGPLFDIDGNLLGIHSRIGQHLANNVHIPLHLFRADWSRLAQGDVWGHK